MAAALTSPVHPALTVKTDFDECVSFPTYIDPFDSSEDTFAESDDAATMDSSTASSPLSNPISNKLVDSMKENPSRHASPRPTEISAHPISRTNGNGYRVLRSATVGYIAPEFKEKADQMKQGTSSLMGTVWILWRN